MSGQNFNTFVIDTLVRATCLTIIELDSGQIIIYKLIHGAAKG